MGTMSWFFSIYPKVWILDVISELLSVNVDFYEQIPNIVITDKGKQICSLTERQIPIYKDTMLNV